MSLIEHAIVSSQASAKHHDPSLTDKPAPKVAIITCMDPSFQLQKSWSTRQVA
jgi:carbonic anhydrase